MVLIGIGASLLVAFLISLCMYSQSWLDLARPLLAWRQPQPQPQPQTQPPQPTDNSSDPAAKKQSLSPGPEPSSANAARDIAKQDDASACTPAETSGGRDRAMPQAADGDVDKDEDEDEEGPATPKASAQRGAASVPAFSLSEPASPPSPPSPRNMPPPMFPAPFSAQRAGSSASSSSSVRPAAPGLMAPPPLPGRRPPALSPAAAARNNNLPVPNRGLRAPPMASSSLAPPPTTETRPNKPNARNKVILTPGHSPLDWARLTTDPRANLRNLPPEAPQLLRVTPSMLKKMNGRRGRDAWTALGGMVYNLTPYVPFHPGGAGELLRCAGRDGNRLFNEVHSWVNYDNMLSACRVGILVEEHEATSNPMEEMD